MNEEDIELPKHLATLAENIEEVTRLVEIHKEIAGAKQGRKSGVEVLNKSAIVLLVACWETFIEEIASVAFNLILKDAPNPYVFPNKVLVLASRDLRKHKDETKVWELAASGWKRVLRKHRDSILSKFVSPFNTPNTQNINRLFNDLVGIKNISFDWYWQRMSVSQTKTKLDRLIKLRGQIAHSVRTEKSVHKTTVIGYVHFIKRLAGVINNSLNEYIEERTGSSPWCHVDYVGQE